MKKFIKKEITFIKSAIPKNLEVLFKKIEKNKLKQAHDWLKNHKKGNDKKILKEQKTFQKKVKNGIVKQSVS